MISGRAHHQAAWPCVTCDGKGHVVRNRITDACPRCAIMAESQYFSERARRPVRKLSPLLPLPGDSEAGISYPVAIPSAGPGPLETALKQRPREVTLAARALPASNKKQRTKE